MTKTKQNEKWTKLNGKYGEKYYFFETKKLYNLKQTNWNGEQHHLIMIMVYNHNHNDSLIKYGSFLLLLLAILIIIIIMLIG